MTTFKILVSDKLHPQAIGWLESQSDIEVVSEPTIEPDQLTNIIAQFDALIVRSRTKVRSDLINKASSLKVIGRAGSGLDNIDVEDAKAAGIQVLNSPGANANAVAELALGLMIALARQFPSNFVATEKPKRYGWELRDKTLGILGLGQIGTRVARLADAFGMNLLGFDVIPDAGPDDVRFTRASVEEIFGKSDVITIHVPLMDETRDLISQKSISQMREGVTIINSARADLVDEAAMLEALKSGRVRGYAADAIALSELRNHENVICTPHIGAQTEEAQIRAGTQIAESVVSALRGLS